MPEPNINVQVNISGKELINAVQKLILSAKVIDGKKWNIRDAQILTRAGATIKIAVEEALSKGK